MKLKAHHAIFFYLKGFYICMFLCIITRLYYLQIYKGADFERQSQKNYTRHIGTTCMRGQIYDTHGNLLATNRPVIHLLWQPNKRALHEQQEIVQSLCELCGIPHAQELIYAIPQHAKRKQPMLLKKNISVEELSIIQELYPENPSILIETDVKRYYPYQNLASHIIGYLGAMDMSGGKMGLEKACENLLQGTTGTLIKTVDARGTAIATQELHPSHNGQDIHTTIDIQLQKLVEAAFTAEHVGSFIIMDPNSGAIRAMLSRPNFNPGIFLEPISHYDWQELQKDQPFLNRAISCAYPPGSLFKLVTASAALQNEIIQEAKITKCSGSIIYGNRTYWCHQRQGHGALSVKQALAKSCNILFYEVGTKISIDILADYAQRFGLGEKTGFLLNESVGLIPNSHWKIEQKGERWWPGETLSAAIGQSYLLTTPLQIARMISGIFTGYLVKPRILEAEDVVKIPLAIEQSTLEFLRDSMRSVVTEGTGHRVNRIKDITIYAKTSTAQTSTIDKRNLGRQYFEHGWVVAHFSYKQEPPLTLVVLVEHAGGSRTPVLIAKQFLLSYRDARERNDI